MKRILLAIPLVLLTACDDGNIKLVKEMVTPIDSSITLGNAYDHRNICKSVSWDKYKDARGRDIVKYNCMLDASVTQSYIDSSVQAQVNDALKVYDNEVANYTRQIQMSSRDAEMLSKVLNDMSQLYESGLVTKAIQSIRKTNEVASEYISGKGPRSYVRLEDRLAKILELKEDKFIELFNLERLEAQADQEIVDLLNEVQQDIVTLKNFIKEKSINADAPDLVSYLNRGDYPQESEEIAKLISKTKEHGSIYETYLKYWEAKRDDLAKNLASWVDVVKINELSQSVYFSIIKNEPMVVGCEFNVSTPEEKYELTNKNCFAFSYSSEGDKIYPVLSDQVFKKEIYYKLASFIRDELAKSRKGTENLSNR